MTFSEDKFVDLYQQYRRHVYAYCRRRTGSEHAEDATADTFLVAWRRLDDIPEGGSALAWLYGVAYRVLGHHWRSRSRHRELEKKLSSLGVEAQPTPEVHVVNRHEKSQVVQAAAMLRAKEVEILRLAVWEELRAAEIGIVLGLSVDAVRQRLSRAKRSLAIQYNRLDANDSEPTAAQKGGGT
jgi:RNA polymerase sigma-70 factor (ECF subfamily)